MFDFASLDTYGKQITAFITETKALLISIETEVKAFRAENTELKAQVTRIEGAHLILMEWLAEIDESEAQELADVAVLAAATATEAAATATEAAATVEETPVEVEPVQETTPPVVETPAESHEETTTTLPETEVPEEPTVVPDEQPLSKSKRRWI